ncbi:MAG: proline dehydrogenase family protein [Gemmatimonadota bacterium]|nr:proline dehydrogenase family protein [Gemmatimonadota bacterium]
MGLARQLLLHGSRNRWLARRLPRRRFVRRAVRRFMPGEELSDATGAAARLGERGFGTIFTLLGENVTSGDEARGVADQYVAAVEAIEAEDLDTGLSVKPTHLGLDIGPEVAAANLDSLLGRAGTADRDVALDMEATPYVDPTLELYRRLRPRHPRAGICLQAYLYRTADDLESLLPLSPAIRLVKGAYAEPPGLAWPRKSDVDESYLRLATRMLEARRGDEAMQPAFGTHDERLIDEIRARAESLGIPAGAVEFQLLYGIRRELQERLLAAGHRVRILISYGPHWFPWYMRRLAERPANVGFVLRSLFRN